MIPTTTGWHWAEQSDDPVWIEVHPERGPMYAGTPLARSGLTILAMVPGKAVSVALAECEAAEYRWSADEPETDEINESLDRDLANAEARLYAALRKARVTE